jgi:ABC-2 type transport system permease protein
MNIALHDIKSSWKGTVLLLLVFAGFVVMVMSIYPTIKESSGIVEFMENLPQSFLAFFGVEELDISLLEGYLNLEFYQWFWTLFLGIYFAFISSSLISKEIENKTIDMLLSNPVSRRRVVLEKFLGCVPTIILINVVMPLVVLGCAHYITETINVPYLFYTHFASIPYLCAACALGLLFSVIFDETRRANLSAIGVISGMYIIETLSELSEKYSAIGNISIVHYYDPGDILIHHNIEAADTAALFLITAVLLIAAVIYFEKRDIAIS